MNRVYQINELVGTSKESIEGAIENAIRVAAGLHGKLDWYEVMQTRGYIEEDKTRYYQVHVRIGCHAH